MNDKSWTELLAEHDGNLSAMIEADTAFLESKTALTPQTKYLMAMAFDAIANRPAGVRSYAMRARESGATRAQIIDTIRLLRMFFGRPGMIAGIDGLRDE